jgi:hypothetical protein
MNSQCSLINGLLVIIPRMGYAASLVLNIITVLVNICSPGGARSVMAENVALRQQLLVLKRAHKRAPKLKSYERTLLGALVSLISHKRLSRTAIRYRVFKKYLTEKHSTNLVIFSSVLLL